MILEFNIMFLAEILNYEFNKKETKKENQGSSQAEMYLDDFRKSVTSMYSRFITNALETH